jgi:hypothetical protein
MTKQRYIITVGEAGNEIGHDSSGDYMSDEHARAAALRKVRDYRGDGWWAVRDDVGREIGRGGRRSL